jgi:hypothetical protein
MTDWYPLVAEHARFAARDGGPCPVCQRLLGRGQRICDLPDGGPVIHTNCASQAAEVTPAAITVSNALADDTPGHKVRRRH